MKRHAAMRGREIGVEYAEAFVQHRGHAYPANRLDRCKCSATSQEACDRHGTGDQQSGAAIGGTTPRSTSRCSRDAAQLTERDLAELSRPGFEVAIVRHARGVLSRRSPRIRAGLAAGHPRQSRRHLRADRARPSNCRWWRGSSTPLNSSCTTPIFGAWTSGSKTANPCRSTIRCHFAKADMDLCFNRIDRNLRMPQANIHFPTDLEAYSHELRPGALRPHAGRPGRSEALGVQRPPEARGRLPRPSRRRRPSIASSKTRITDLHPMTVIQNARTSGGGYVPQVPTQACHGRAGRNLEGRLRVHLAPGPSRQPLRHPPDRADDRQKAPRQLASPCRCWPTTPTYDFNYYRAGIGNVAAEMH